MTEKILFFFSALGVFNALLLAVYLVAFRSGRSLSDRFLAVLVLLVVVRVGVSCFQFFGPIPFGFIKVGLMANLLMGPAVYFTVKLILVKNKEVVNQSLVHLGLWSLAFAIAWFVFDPYIWDWRIRFVLHFGLAVYLVATALTWRKALWSFIRSRAVTSEVKKASVIYLSLVLICAGFALSLFTSYVLGPLIFSVIFYAAMGYFFLSRQQARKQNQTKRLAASEFNKLNDKLVRLMETEKLYRNPDLNLEMLAGKLAVSRHLLSQLLNDNLNKNFHQYINDHRIQEACQLLVEQKHYSIEAVGMEVGFHSRSSFFTSFKRLKGMTPSSFRKQA